MRLTILSRVLEDPESVSRTADAAATQPGGDVRPTQLSTTESVGESWRETSLARVALGDHGLELLQLLRVAFTVRLALLLLGHGEQKILGIIEIRQPHRIVDRIEHAVKRRGARTLDDQRALRFLIPRPF